MRKLEKLDPPAILLENADKWTSEYLADQDNESKKRRYKHRDIKAAVIEESDGKCIYCESKLGETSPGDIEHKTPIGKFPDRAFDWENLTYACTECNRRKSDYHSTETPFLDPFTDEVEEVLIHHGPLVMWRPDSAEAEVSVIKLELNSENRAPLIFRKTHHLESIANLIQRWETCGKTTLKEVLKLQIQDLSKKHSEYSAMAMAFLTNHGRTELLPDPE